MGGGGGDVGDFFEDIADSFQDTASEAGRTFLPSAADEALKDTEDTAKNQIPEGVKTAESGTRKFLGGADDLDIDDFLPENAKFGNKSKNNDEPPITAAPEAPKLPEPLAKADSGAQAQEAVKKRRRLFEKSRTVYTSPLGLTGQSNMIKNYLTGQ